MGFDIDINFFNIENGQATFVKKSDSCYLSYNWSNLSHICPEHSFDEKGECPDNTCEQLPLWYFRSDCHGRAGTDIVIRAEKALKLLETYNIRSNQINITKDIAWGNNLDARERLAAFAYHINNFKILGEQYPDHFFIGDVEIAGLTLLDGTFVEFNDDSSSDDSSSSDDDNNEKRIVTFYRHPLKGTFRIDSFESAMEIFGLLKALNSPSAQQWYDLALQMHDAPSKT
jgi:hypothetical protein